MCKLRPPQCVLHTPLMWYDRQKWRPLHVWGIPNPFAVASLIAVRIRNPGLISICGAGWGFCSCALFLRMPYNYGVGVVPAYGLGVSNAWRRGAAGGGGGLSGGASPPGRVTRSGWKFPVAISLLRISKFGHRTLCRLSNDLRKLLLNS